MLLTTLMTALFYLSVPLLPQLAQHKAASRVILEFIVEDQTVMQLPPLSLNSPSVRLSAAELIHDLTLSM